MTFTILENFPQDLLDELKAIWYEGDWKREIEASPGSMWHHHLRASHPIFERFPEETRTLEYYSNPPHCGNGPHLDRGRWSAMNIPIEMDHENSYFFAGKTHLLKGYTRKRHLDQYKDGHKVNSTGPIGFFKEEEGKFDYYNLEKPVLFSTKTPHGFANNSDRPRVLLSATFNLTYEQMLNILPEEWFA
jgi:hypothetical protein